MSKPGRTRRWYLSTLVGGIGIERFEGRKAKYEARITRRYFRATCGGIRFTFEASTGLLSGYYIRVWASQLVSWSIGLWVGALVGGLGQGEDEGSWGFAKEEKALPARPEGLVELFDMASPGLVL